MYKPSKTLLASFVLYAVILKVLPFALSYFGGMDTTRFSIYPWSFTPIFAMGLFGVAMFKDLKSAFFVPLFSFLIAEVLIGAVCVAQYGWDEGLKYAIYPGQPMTYLSLAALCCCGFIVRAKRNWGTVFGGCALGCIAFFAISNFGVWYFDIGENYPQSLAGLKACYIAAIPFAKNQVISTFLYGGLLFSPLGIGYLKANSEEVEATEAVPSSLATN